MKTDDLIDLLSRDLPTEPVRPVGVLLRWLPLAAAGALALLGLTLGFRPGLTTAEVMAFTSFKWLFGLVLTTAAGIAALRLARPDAPPGGLGMTAAAALAALVVAFLFDTTGLTFADMSFRAGLKCLVVVPLLALPLMAAILAALGEGAVTEPRLAGGLAGLAAGGMAILIYALYCTEDGAAFISVWYVTAALAAGAVGAFSGPRLLRW